MSVEGKRILVYTVSRADTPAQVERALGSLHAAQSATGLEHDWILWANAPGIREAAGWAWTAGRLWGTGENQGQHVALAEVLAHARGARYDYIVKVDDDLEWSTPRWLRKMVAVEEACHDFSKKYPLLAARVRGLRHPIPIAARIKLPGGIPLLVVPIVGGACRLHHVSFFDGYVPDVRRALGAGGDTSINSHAEAMHIPNFITPWVNVRHATAEMESRDPAYFQAHPMFQVLPYIPPWHPEDPADGKAMP
jgi:hypothetical protein